MKKRLTLILLFSLILLSACSLSKYKDFSSYSNLLMGTNNGTANYRLMDNGYNASLEADGDAVKVTMSSHLDSGWLVLFFDDGNSRNILGESTGDVYTISFDVKTNMKDTEIRVSHKKADSKENQIDFGTATIKKVNKWSQVILTSKLTGAEASSQGLYIDLRNNPVGTEISIRNLKLIKGVP